MTIREDNKVLFSVKTEAVSSNIFNLEDESLSFCVKSDIVKLCNIESALSLRCRIAFFPIFCFKQSISDFESRFSLNLNESVYISVTSAQRPAAAGKRNEIKRVRRAHGVRVGKFCGEFLNSKCVSFRL